MTDQEKNFDVKQSLALVCYAKNCYLDRYGFSPFQKVFGRNPSVPNFFNENNLVLNEEKFDPTKQVAQLLKLLDETRINFLKAESELN